MLCYCMVCVVKDMHKLTLDHLGIDMLLIFCEWLLIYNYNLNYNYCVFFKIISEQKRSLTRHSHCNMNTNIEKPESQEK